MYINKRLLIGKTDDGKELAILPQMANRHGIITGASGSGKTITLKVMAESFSDAGVPVFLADVKGDLAGTACVGEINENIEKRLKKLDLKGFEAKQYPVRFWDLYGQSGHPVRATVESVGPEVLSIMLGLSEAQEGNLAIAFAIAKDENLALIDLKDLRAVLQYVSENRDKYSTRYGNITTQSIGVIQRSLLTLENQGADHFFGQPALNVNDFFAVDNEGRGIINILHAVTLFESPDMYAAFLLWLLSTLFSTSPEVGDLEKPKLVFFFVIDIYNACSEATHPQYAQILRQMIVCQHAKSQFFTRNLHDRDWHGPLQRLLAGIHQKTLGGVVKLALANAGDKRQVVNVIVRHVLLLLIDFVYDSLPEIVSKSLLAGAAQRGTHVRYFLIHYIARQVRCSLSALTSRQIQHLISFLRRQGQCLCHEFQLTDLRGIPPPFQNI